MIIKGSNLNKPHNSVITYILCYGQYIMSTKITTCDKCKSTNIKELNSENRETVNKPLCKIDCVCNDCGFTFTINSWTKSGKRRGIRY